MIVPERRLELPRYSQSQQAIKVQETRLSNSTAQVKITQQLNTTRPIQRINMTSKSSAQIKVHKDFFNIFDQPEKSYTQNLFGATTQRMTMNHNNKKSDLLTQTSQSNIDLFNMNLATKGPVYAPKENRLPSMSREFRKVVRGTTQLKPIGKNTLDHLKLIKEFVQANNFV